ncbi:MAG: response regulator [Gammaproteobacteria bacterium]
MSELNQTNDSILIIDHDINDALQLDKILQNYGYKVDIYTNYSDLEQIINTANPTIVLLDFKTCFIENSEILKLLNNIQENLLSIVIIENNDIDSATNLFSEGIYDFINKPYIAENIKIRVKHCIDQTNLCLEKIKIEKALETSEDRYSRAVRGTNDGMWDWNINTGEIYFSNRWKEMLGYSNEQFPQNYNDWRSIIHPDDSGKSLIHCVNLLDDTSNTLDFEYRLLTKQNNYKWIHIRAMASYNNSGAIEFISGSHSDITEKKQTLFDRQRLETQLRQSHKMKALGQLTGGIAHDFNNILASIMGYAELTKEFLLNETNNRLVSYQEEILIAGARARDLISQLLTYSRDSGGNSSNVSLQPLVKEVVKLLKSSFPTTIDISLNIEDDLPSIVIDPIQIEQVIMNHCLNSKEAMDGKGQLKISVTYENLDSNHEHICKSCHETFDGGYVVFTFDDTGRGIDSKSLNKIFDPYVTTKEFGDGPGMGLSVIHGIVHQHKGHICVNSTLGQGSSFELYFPAVKNIKVAESKIQYLPLPDATDSAAKQKILVVDDEKPVADYLGEYLKLHGYQTTVFTNSEKALELVKSAPDEFDLLITDLTMPNLTGIELAKECSKFSKNMSVIVCSGNNELIKNPDYNVSSIKDVISKPFIGSQLLTTVATVLK